MIIAKKYSLFALALLVTASATARADSVLKTGPNYGCLSHSDEMDTVRQNSHRDVYIAHLKAGYTYFFDLQSKAFDTYLRLESCHGMPLAYNDDGGPGLNSRLKFVPQNSGTFRVIVTSYRPEATGAYKLNLSTLGIPIQAKTVKGFLSKFDPEDKNHRHYDSHWQFLKAGRKYTIKLDSNSFDTLLYVKTATGQTIAFNDDGGPGLNARATFIAPTSGMYRIIATSYKSHVTGAYQLTIISQ